MAPPFPFVADFPATGPLGKIIKVKDRRVKERIRARRREAATVTAATRPGWARSLGSETSSRRAEPIQPRPVWRSGERFSANRHRHGRTLVVRSRIGYR